LFSLRLGGSGGQAAADLMLTSSHPGGPAARPETGDGSVTTFAGVLVLVTICFASTGQEKLTWYHNVFSMA
jgi:hypothetical protein